MYNEKSLIRLKDRPWLETKIKKKKKIWFFLKLFDIFKNLSILENQNFL